MISKILTALMIAVVFSVNAFASNTDEYYKDSLEASGAKELADYLSDETEDYLEKLGCDGLDFEKILSVSPESVFSLILDTVREGYKKPLKCALSVSGIVLLASISSAFFSNDEKTGAILNIIFGGALVLCIFMPASQSIKAAVSAMQMCSDFEKALIPVLAGILTAGGNPALALSFKGAAFAAAESVQAFSNDFALPLVGVSGALSVSGAMLPTLRLNAISDVIRKTLVTTLGCMTGLFTGFLSLKSILASSADGMIVKGVKMAASFVPVVGGALGEAYTSVAASISLLKSTVGIYAIIALALTCIPCAVSLFMWSLAMRISCTVSELTDCRACSDILKAVSFIFSMTNAILLLCFAVFAVSSGIVLSIRGG